MSQAYSSSNSVHANGNGKSAPQRSSAFDTHSAAVKLNPLDFNSWVQLLSIMETDGSIEIAVVRKTFDEFLGIFPLCFGYWNKYATYEYKLGKSNDVGEPPKVEPVLADKNARQVFERGVSAVSYSVDMWMNYCKYLLDTIKAEVEEGRSVLERAVVICGTDPTSGPLWDKYISFETEQNEMDRLNAIFKRILTMPLLNLEEFWEKYNQFVLAQQLSTLATSEELDELAVDGEASDEGLLRIKLVESMERVKNSTAAEVSKRTLFEKNVDRSYFHVTPLSSSALSNWHSYLDFEEMQGDKKKIKHLYERCLVACANYSEFWVRYAYWQEEVFNADAAIKVFLRAMEVHLKNRADIYLEYAVLLESLKRIEDAREVYTKVLKNITPNLAEGIVRFSNFERRQGDMQTALNMLDEGIKSSSGDSLAYLAIQKACLYDRVLLDTEKARKIYKETLATTTSSRVLWLSYINFEIEKGGKGMISRVIDIFDSALADGSMLDKDGKSDVWFRFEDFMDTYGSSIENLRSVMDRGRIWRRSNSASRKRGLSSSSSNRAAKQSKSTTSQYYNTPQPQQNYSQAYNHGGYSNQQYGSGY